LPAARRTPLVAALPKMVFPFLVIVPGMIVIALQASRGGILPMGADGTPEYNLAMPVLLAHYMPTGLLGLGLTALMASFMSGMAGNVTAFNTVWTYDIYQSYIRPGQSDRHYLRMGHAATVFGILLSIAAAYATTKFNNIMDMLQLVFAFVNAPLFATFLLGMFWRRTTGHGAFSGLLLGTCAAALHHGLTLPHGAVAGLKGGFFGVVLQTYPSEMAQNFWTAIWAWTTCFVATIVISLATRQRKANEDLRGLVYALTPRIKDKDLPWYRQPATLALIVLALTVVLNVVFW
jgi:SSS family solute:Na+ symporter